MNKPLLILFLFIFIGLNIYSQSFDNKPVARVGNLAIKDMR